MSPRLLLMDEPLTSLDAGLKNRILPYLYHIKGAFDIPLLYVTHSISEVMALADEAFILSDGQITARGQPHRTARFSFCVACCPDDGCGEYSGFAGGRCVGGARGDGIGVGGAEIDGFVYGDGARRDDADRYPGAGYHRCDGLKSADECAKYFARDNPGDCCSSGRVMLSVDIEGHLLSVEVTSDAREQLGLAEGTVCYFIIKASAINLLWEG